MAGITLSQAESQLSALLTAHEAIMNGAQEYKIGDRFIRRANLAELREDIKFWNSMVKSLARGGIRITGGTPT